jgi:hypothetical protein
MQLKKVGKRENKGEIEMDQIQICTYMGGVIDKVVLE